MQTLGFLGVGGAIQNCPNRTAFAALIASVHIPKSISMTHPVSHNVQKISGKVKNQSCSNLMKFRSDAKYVIFRWLWKCLFSTSLGLYIYVTVVLFFIYVYESSIDVINL